MKPTQTFWTLRGEEALAMENRACVLDAREGEAACPAYERWETHLSATTAAPLST